MPYKNPEARRAHDRLPHVRAANREYNKKYYLKHHEALKADMRGYRQDHLEQLREYDRVRRNLPHRIALKKEYWSRTLTFGNEQIYLSWLPPLSHKCSICQKENCKTDRHHAKGYFPIFIWFGIEELCSGCHAHVREIKPETKEKCHLNAIRKKRDSLTGRFV